MSGDTTYQALDRLTYLPSRTASHNGLVIAGQNYYDVYFTGGTISGVNLSLSSPLAISSGGTGQTTANAALNALLPSQVGQSGKILSTNGTNTSWMASGSAGTVTSVSVVTANGVSGSVATATTTPAITLTLGAITPTTIVASGNISGANLSGTNTGDQTSVTGNAGTATALQTARNINGVSFNGTADITVTAAAGTLTGTTLNSTVVTSSLTALGTVTTGTWSATTIAVNKGGTGVTSSKPIIQQVRTLTGSVATGTTIIPLDDTIPQQTEGDQYMSLAITPTNSSNILRIDVIAVVSHSAATAQMTEALFQDSGTNALAVTAAVGATSTGFVTLPLTYYMVAGTTSSTTFKVRAGANVSGTTTFNGISGGRIYGGVMASSIIITEIAV